MRLRRGARHQAPESVPVSQPTETPLPQPPTAPQNHDSLVYELLANVALRDLTVIERILSVISDVERGEQDPERLSLYYALDHDVTRLRRSAENALVLAGAQAPMGRSEPMTLLDVARAAASESADYTRVSVGRLPQVAVGPAVADDLSHTLAELMDNALSVSPSRAQVTVTGTQASGGVLVAVEDEGIGIPPELLPELNTRLTGPLVLDPPSTRQMGLYVVAHLARRHGIYVQLQSRRQLGSAAVTFLPDRLLLQGPATGQQAASVAPSPPLAARIPAQTQVSRPTHVPPPARHQAQPDRRTRRGYQGPTGAEPVPTGMPATGGATSHRREQPQAPAPQPPQPQPPQPMPVRGQQQLPPPPAPQPQPQSQPLQQTGFEPDPWQVSQRTYSSAGEPQPYQPTMEPAQMPAPPAGPAYPQPPSAQPAQSPPPYLQPTPPPVAPATVDRWAPSRQEREQPTDFTDQGLPRRTRPATPRATPGPPPREAKPADPGSVLADLDAFAAGTADALSPAHNPAYDPGPGSPAAPPLLTDPAQEEF